MNIDIQKRSDVEATIKIRIPSGIVNERLKTYFESLSKKAKLPGFRPGKAPASVVRQNYGQEAAADLSERLIAEFLGRAVDEHKLELVLPPLLLATDLPKDDTEFKFEVEVHLKPHIKSIKFDSLSIEVPSGKPVTDEDVLGELNAIREMDASYSDIKLIRPATDKDCVVVSYTGSVDGVARDDMKAEMQTVALGQNRFLPDFERAIIGMSVGETKTFPVSFPADYHEESLRGKTAQFSISLNGLKEKVLPELTDDFAKGVDPKLNSLEELKTRIRSQIQMERDSELDKVKRDAVGDLLVSKNPFEVSTRQVDQMAERLAQQAHHMMHQMGVPHKEDEDNARALKESSMKKAERDIKLSYILESISKDQKIEVNVEDIKKRIEETAKKTGYSITQVQQYYAQKDEDEGPSRIERLKIDIQDEKSLDYALSKATIKLKD